MKQWIGMILSLMLPLGASAAEWQVSHHPAAGQYGSVIEAVSAASAGDTITLIDHSAPFVGNVTLDKPLILRGQPDLDPRPVIAGTLDAVDGVSGQVLTFHNGSDGTVVKDLIIDGQNTSIAVAGWSGGRDLQFQNCQILGPSGTAGENGYSHSITAVFWFPGVTMTDCDLVGGALNYVTEGGGEAGLQTLTRCTLREARKHAVQMTPEVPRQVVLNHCDISQLSLEQGTFVAGAPSLSLTLTDCLIHPDTNTGAASFDSTLIMWGGANELTIDHCDFVGAASHNAITLLESMNKVSVTNNIFTGYTRYWWTQGTAIGSADLLSGAEDYNVYGDGLANDIAAADEPDDTHAYPAGAHDLNLTAGAPIYVDAAAGNYYLNPDSAANNFPTTGQHAGSLGVKVTVNAAQNWEMFE